MSTQKEDPEDDVPQQTMQDVMFQYESLENEVEYLLSQLDYQQARSEGSEAEVELLRSRLDNQKAKNEELSTVNPSLKNNRRSQEKVIDKLHMEISQLIRKNKDTDSIRIQLTDYYDKLAKEADELLKDNNDMDAAQKQLTDDYDKLVQEKEASLATKQELSTENAKLQADRAEMQAKYEALLKENAELRKQAEKGQNQVTPTKQAVPKNGRRESARTSTRGNGTVSKAKAGAGTPK